MLQQTGAASWRFVVYYLLSGPGYWAGVFGEAQGKLVEAVRKTIGHYLVEPTPPFALWTDLLGVLFEGSPHQPRLERVGPTARTVYLVRMFGGQLSNGGFHQFLANLSGDYTAETLEALRQVGATVSSELLEQALSLFPRAEAPREQPERIRLLSDAERVQELLDDLDGRAYHEVDPIEGEGCESLDNLLLAYMQARAGEAVLAEPGTGADSGRAPSFSAFPDSQRDRRS
jgi:hypothetical protein